MQVYVLEKSDKAKFDGFTFILSSILISFIKPPDIRLVRSQE